MNQQPVQTNRVQESNQIFMKNVEVFLKTHPDYRPVMRGRSSFLQYPDVSSWIRDEGDAWILSENDLILADSREKSPLKITRETQSSLVVLEGFGLGEGVRQILEAARPFSTLVVIEPSIEVFLAACFSVSFEDIFSDTRVRFLVGKASTACFLDFVDLLRNPERSLRMETVQFLRSSRYDSFHASYFDRVRIEWSKAVAEIRGLAGSSHENLERFHHFMSNLGWIEQNAGISALQDAFRSRPAIVVGPGPLSSPLLKALKKAEEKAVLIVDASQVELLAHEQIRPTLVLSSEQSLENLRSTTLDSEAHIFAYPTSSRESLSKITNPAWVAYRQTGYFYFAEEQIPRGILQGSTPLLYGIRLAIHMGCYPLVFLRHENLEDRSFQRDLREASLEALQRNLAIFDASENSQATLPIQLKSLESLVPLWRSADDWIKILDARHRLHEKKSFDWTETREFVEALVEKSVSIASRLDSLKQESFEPQAQKKILRMLRSTQMQLLEDARFVCFIVQNAGAEFLHLENQWAVMESQNSSMSFDRQLDLLANWFYLIRSTTAEVNKIFKSATPSLYETAPTV